MCLRVKIVSFGGFLQVTAELFNISRPDRSIKQSQNVIEVQSLTARKSPSVLTCHVVGFLCVYLVLCSIPPVSPPCVASPSSSAASQSSKLSNSPNKLKEMIKSLNYRLCKRNNLELSSVQFDRNVFPRCRLSLFNLLPSSQSESSIHPGHGIKKDI